MTKADYDGSVEDMHLANGLPWAMPVDAVACRTRRRGKRIALESAEGELLAVLDVEEVFDVDRENEAAKTYRTTDEAAPRRGRRSTPRARPWSAAR